jgi:hypothetical protein
MRKKLPPSKVEIDPLGGKRNGELGLWQDQNLRSDTMLGIIDD